MRSSFLLAPAHCSSQTRSSSAILLLATSLMARKPMEEETPLREGKDSWPSDQCPCSSLCLEALASSA